MDCEGVGIAISVVSSGRRISLMRQGGRELFPPLGMLVFVCLLFIVFGIYLCLDLFVFCLLAPRVLF